MRYFAEIGQGNLVTRVIVADSLEDCEQIVGGGPWVETFDSDPVQRYAGIGMRYDSSTPEKFHAEGNL